MLVMSRKRDEVIVIGDRIRIRVLRVGTDGVRLGVIAPPELSVHRQEIYELIVKANRSAASSPAGLQTMASQLRLQATRPSPGPSQG
jgi:carbon storage regulator